MIILRTMAVRDQKLAQRTLFILIFFCSLPAFSQTYYPLEKGNRWDYGYYSSPQQAHYAYSVSITGDTIMQNGLRYAIEQSPDSGMRFLRQQGGRVYQFIVPGIDSLLYDFTYAYLWGETLSVSYQGNDTLVTTVNSHHAPVFDITRAIWIFYTYASDRSLYREVKIADSLGCFEIEKKGHPSLFLMGAVINGTRYGTALTGIHDTSVISQKFVLYQNYPNPFNPATTIRYDVPGRSSVTLRVFNVLGQEVRTLVNEAKDPGSFSFEFDAGSLPTGVYYYRLTAGDYSLAKVMLLIR
jgi:hypothetical protein